MIVRRLNRRTVLRGAAGVALGLPLLDAMRGRSQAAVATPPKRIILYFTPNGLVPDAVRCAVTAPDSTTFTLSSTLQPFAPIRDKCLFIDGMPMNSGYDPKQTAVAHAGGMASLFTGSYSPPGQMYGGFGTGTSGYPATESLDHAIARQVGDATRFPSYYFGVRVEGNSLLHCCFYAGKDQPITANANPVAVRNELFGEALDQTQAVRAQQLQDRNAILDAVTDSARALRCRLGAEDRTRLDLHLSQVEDMQKSLGAVISTNPACVRPTVAADIQPNDFSQMPQIGRAQADLLAMALACDLTRVGGFYWNPPISDPVYTWLGQNEGHHSITHEPTKFNLAADVNRWHAQELMYLVNKLKSIPEGEGTVFDNTVIVWASECANSKTGDPHDLHNVFFTLLGDGQAFFKTGRYLKFPGGDAYSHNRLLLTLLRYMGVNQEVFGEAKYCAGGPLATLVR